MAGITPINMLSMYSIGMASGGSQRLTATTKAKLEALGVDTKEIRTEAEGQMKLKEAQMSSSSGVQQSKPASPNEDSVLEEAKALASKLDISVSSTDTVDEIVDKITEKIEDMKLDAGKDFDKQANIKQYETELAMLEKSHMSQIDLSATMNLTASMNMAYHNLY